MLERLTKFSFDRPKTVIAITLLVTVLFALQFPRITIDTDPENMLEPDQPDRVLYDRIKEEFGIRDMLVVGIVDERGIFRPESLERIARATSEILKIKGVIIDDVVSLTTTDNVRSAGGMLDIRPVMSSVPSTAEQIEAMRRQIAENPFLHEKIASEDGTAVALYVPIERKDMSYRIGGEIESILSRELLDGQRYHLAGLPVAEDTFGHEMFLQMAIVAPLAFMGIMLLIFLLFRLATFLVPVGMTALFSVVWAMGLLIGMGKTVHIMSSMIPVFLMPIAILDDVHILSACADRFCQIGDKRRAVLEAMRPLFRPMLFTSLTSAVGFASLSLADIPPVRIFGLFVAFGIMAAWILSMTMVPAVMSLMSEESLREGLGRGGRISVLDRFLSPLGGFTYRKGRAIITVGLLLILLGVIGVLRIDINDNPVKWFKPGHPVRTADIEMNRLFGGTYMAYILAEGNGPDFFKSPEALEYVSRVQAHLEEDPLVGKTSSVADIVRRINFVLHDGEEVYDAIPKSFQAVGQFLFLFQSSGDPNDLDNFLNREASRANVWVQMKGGDNHQMEEVEQRLADFTRRRPGPDGLELRWSGLTYINKIWQDLMVFGMLKAILGSFLIVFILMCIEFRSFGLGLLSMIPMSLAILLSYGLIGWVGKDYDMPIAVCSSLSLGLGIDFAIHFIHRFKSHFAHSGDREETNRFMFGEPGRAIARNAIVITLGFLPLAASSLTPYVTVGIFFALLMFFSTLSTMFVLPAALGIAGPRILKGGRS